MNCGVDCFALQELINFNAPASDSIVRGRVAPSVFCIQARIMLYKQLHSLKMPLRGCDVKGCAPVIVKAICRDLKGELLKSIQRDSIHTG
jgi:hypothetical protein